MCSYSEASFDVLDARPGWDIGDKVDEPLLVNDALNSRALNTLVLYPDAQNPERSLKAWVELHPAKAADEVARQ